MSEGKGLAPILLGVAAVITAIGTLGLFDKSNPSEPKHEDRSRKEPAGPEEPVPEIKAAKIAPAPSPQPSAVLAPGKQKYYAKISEDENCPAQRRLVEKMQDRQKGEPPLAPFHFEVKTFKEDQHKCAVVIGAGPKGTMNTLIEQWDRLEMPTFSHAQLINVDRFADD